MFAPVSHNPPKAPFNPGPVGPVPMGAFPFGCALGLGLYAGGLFVLGVDVCVLPNPTLLPSFGADKGLGLILLLRAEVNGFFTRFGCDIDDDILFIDYCSGHRGKDWDLLDLSHLLNPHSPALFLSIPPLNQFFPFQVPYTVLTSFGLGLLKRSKSLENHELWYRENPPVRTAFVQSYI